MTIYRSGKPLSIIAAVARNYALGKNNTLLWHIPEDFRWFKQHTLGHTIIMGKNTFYSLPRRPLPGRRNVVITHDLNLSLPDVEIVSSLDEAIRWADAEKENFIIGGATIYRQFFPFVDKLYITYIDQEYDADVFFPDIRAEDWQLAEVYPQREQHPQGLQYEFRIYQRK